MRCTIQAAVLAVVVLGVSSTVSAVWVDSMVHYVGDGCRENADWPYPYICPDRMAVRQPFEMMITNGWRRQNLIGNYYFNPETNQLTTAGELQIRWILTQAPKQHRQIFVEQSMDPRVTAQRLAATQEFARIAAIDGESPQIYESHMMAEGRSAQLVNVTNVRFLESMPIPVLPERDNSTFESD